jgi:uncharacterized membrane protein HdeD (DUF308 family)
MREELTDQSQEEASVPWWACGLLGAALIATGLYMLANVVVATLATVTLFGIGLIVAGTFEVVYGLWNNGERRVLFSLLVGGLSMAGGAVLLSNPLASTAILTLLFAVTLISSGILRVFLSLRQGSPLAGFSCFPA